MGILIWLLAMATSVVSIICWILVLTKLFPAEGPLKGILGIICGIYTLVWGWMNADQYNIRKIMQLWTACIVLGIIFQVLMVMMSSS